MLVTGYSQACEVYRECDDKPYILHMLTTNEGEFLPEA